ncbi:MAG: protein kinase [Deltaproteobacteria bacterium]|jgi:serine/threonine-protein kinase|nr:protein kinase [Deltaproteobacteria bacterium]MBW2532836.1 protein kinase [Deltaproteobacteria bacterium]
MGESKSGSKSAEDLSSADEGAGIRRKSGLIGKQAATGVHARTKPADDDPSEDEAPSSKPVPDLGLDWDLEDAAPKTPGLKAPPSSKPGKEADASAPTKPSKGSSPGAAEPPPSSKGTPKPPPSSKGTPKPPPSSKRTPEPPPSSRGAPRPAATGERKVDKKLGGTPKPSSAKPSSPGGKSTAKQEAGAGPSSTRGKEPTKLKPPIARKLPPRPGGAAALPRPTGAGKSLERSTAQTRKRPPPMRKPPKPAIDDPESIQPEDVEIDDGEFESIPPEAPERADDTPPPPSDRGMRMPEKPSRASRSVGCCELFSEIATGGMATIHLGRWIGAGRFAKPVAVKALHPQYAKDPDFVAMFLDEARVVARIRHPNVTPTIDLVHEEGELFIVMEYIQGVTLAYLIAKAKDLDQPVPMPVVLRILAGVLHGLHAAHEATDERGKPMGVIHRDVSPENIMVGEDGYARLIDFGIATALGRYSKTRDGELKGKLSYLSPEQVMGKTIDRRADVFAASIVLWQALTGEKLFKAENLVEVAHKVMLMPIEPPTAFAPDVPKELEEIVMRGLERDVSKRWETAEEMAEALEGTRLLALQREVGEWVEKIAGPRLKRNAEVIKAMEAAPVSAGDDSLDRPMTVQAAPKEAISSELESGFKRMRKQSVNLLDSEIIKEARALSAGVDVPAVVPSTSTPQLATAAQQEDLEWTGDVEPAEPIDEAQWEGMPDSNRTPLSGEFDAVALRDPVSSEAQLPAALPTIETDRPPKPASSIVEHVIALPLRTKLIALAGIAVTVFLLGWAIAKLRGGDEISAKPATTAAPVGTDTRPAPARTAAPAPTTTATPTDTATAEEEEPDAGDEPDAGEEAEEDAGAQAEADAGAAAPSWAGKGTVPGGKPWRPPRRNPRYVPPDL